MQAGPALAQAMADATPKQKALCQNATHTMAILARDSPLRYTPPPLPPTPHSTSSYMTPSVYTLPSPFSPPDPPSPFLFCSTFPSPRALPYTYTTTTEIYFLYSPVRHCFCILRMSIRWQALLSISYKAMRLKEHACPHKQFYTTQSFAEEKLLTTKAWLLIFESR